LLPANYQPHIGLQQGTVGQLTAASLAGAKERPFSVLADAGGGDVLLQIAVQIVMRGHLVFLAALLMSACTNRGPSAPDVYSCDAQFHHRLNLFLDPIR